jgi:hypothetical protein
MKTIKKDELYRSLGDFLKTKGVELKDGVYAQRIHRACNLLGDTINATQRTARKAKDEVDRKLDQLRQSIHEATAPKPPPPVSPTVTPSAGKRTKARGSSVGKKSSKARK